MAPAFHATPIFRALEIARWAPSGDNSQPWRFQILDALSVRIYTKHNPTSPYEMRKGTATLIALGALLETLAIGASQEGYKLSWEYEQYADNTFIVVARLAEAGISTDELLPYVTSRKVNRKAMQLKPLDKETKSKFYACLETTGLILTWHEGWFKKIQCSYLSAIATDIRLRVPEAFPIHQSILEWESKTSPNKLPAATLPYGKMTLRLMRWALRSWKRIDWLNRYLCGTMIPILEGDYHTGLRCAAHFTLHTNDVILSPADTIRFGRSIQRVWLTATSLGLTIQPNYAPIIFGYYGNYKEPFTAVESIKTKAAILGKKLRAFMAKDGIDADVVMFFGRMGYPYPEKELSRSLRHPIEELIIP